MKPSPTSPSRRSSETKQFSMTTSAVSEARMPSLFSFLPGRKPSIPLSSTKAEMLWWRGPCGSVTAKTTQTSPTLPWVVKVFEPFRIQPPSTLLGAGAGAGGVGAGAGLGQAPGADLLALGERDQPAAPLLLVAELVDVVAAQRVVRRDADADRGVDLGQLGDDDHVLDVAEAGAAVLLGEDDAEEAELARLGDDLAGELLALVDLVDDRIDLAAGELPRGLLDGALLVGQGKIHVSPPRRTGDAIAAHGPAGDAIAAGAGPHGDPKRRSRMSGRAFLQSG